MRTPIEALREIRNRISYFCTKMDGTWSPPWAQEVYEIAEEALPRASALEREGPTGTAKSFMKDNHYRNAGDRICSNCRFCTSSNDNKMKCNAPGPDPDGFRVFPFGVCDKYERKRT